MLAGLSPTWYTYLEQGRDINPSAEVLDSLARVLGLTEDERRYMHLLARGNVEKSRPLVGEMSASEIVQQLVQTAENSPYPVYGVDLYCDIVAWNPAVTTYYADFDLLPPDRRNMMRWMLEAPEAKERLADWSTDTRDVVARWRAATATQHGGGRLVQLIDEFRQLSPEFGHWWDEHDVREHRSRLRRFRHPQHGDVVMRLIIVQAPDFAPCVVVFHVPVNMPSDPIVE